MCACLALLMSGNITINDLLLHIAVAPHGNLATGGDDHIHTPYPWPLAFSVAKGIQLINEVEFPACWQVIRPARFRLLLFYYELACQHSSQFLFCTESFLCQLP